ncbi:MAG: hypothetical protein HY525_13095 [Betaproteobacteria bacterium]|nr:hypothetical protein [Betaproteobacteria bacterium]
MKTEGSTVGGTGVASLEVMNPVAQIEEGSVRPAARLKDLAGKRIALWWNKKPGGNFAVDRVAELLANRYPGIELRRFSYPFPTNPAALQEVLDSKCDAVIGTSGD